MIYDLLSYSPHFKLEALGEEYGFIIVNQLVVGKAAGVERLGSSTPCLPPYFAGRFSQESAGGAGSWGFS